MLVMGRRVDEAIFLNDDIKIRVVDISGNMVKIGIDAPKECIILREEVWLRNKEGQA